jgi:hypothetical protein
VVRRAHGPQSGLIVSELSDDQLRTASALALDRDADRDERQRAADQVLHEFGIRQRPWKALFGKWTWVTDDDVPGAEPEVRWRLFLVRIGSFEKADES